MQWANITSYEDLLTIKRKWNAIKHVIDENQKT